MLFREEGRCASVVSGSREIACASMRSRSEDKEVKQTYTYCCIVGLPQCLENLRYRNTSERDRAIAPHDTRDCETAQWEGGVEQ